MRSHLFWIIFILATQFAVLVKAQDSPPPPLIYNSPKSSDFKIFVADDKSFEATFAGIPTVETSESETGEIKTYRVYRFGSNSMINVFDFDYDIASGDETFNVLRNNLLKPTNSKIILEKAITLDTYSGKEFDVLQGIHFKKIRYVIDGRRIYEILSDVTNWHILSNYNKDKASQFENETERFFSSFKILKPSKDIYSIADFYGRQTETVYTNPFFNFSVSFPKIWSQLSKSEMENAKTVGLDFLKTDSDRIDRAFEKAANAELVLFAITDPTSHSNMAVGVVKQPSANIRSEDVAKATKTFLLQNPKIALVKDIDTTYIGGRKFSTFQIAWTSLVSQEFFVTRIRGYSLSIVLSSANDAGKKSLYDILSSVRFKVH